MTDNAMRVVCLRVEPRDEATLKGIVDLTLQVQPGAWLLVKNCMYYQLPTGRAWVQWPMIRYEAGRYANVLDWSHADAAAAFQTAALRAIQERIEATERRGNDVTNS